MLTFEGMIFCLQFSKLHHWSQQQSWIALKWTHFCKFNSIKIYNISAVLQGMCLWCTIDSWINILKKSKPINNLLFRHYWHQNKFNAEQISCHQPNFWRIKKCIYKKMFGNGKWCCFQINICETKRGSTDLFQWEFQ